MQKKVWTSLCLILILTCLFQLPAEAQSKKYFIITGKIVPEGGDTAAGSIEITKNEKEKSTIDIPKNGRFRLELDFFNEYLLNFKYPGHFNKIIEVSTQIPQDVWQRDNDFPPFPMIVQLLREFEGIDKSFTQKPLGRIFYGKDIDNFEKESYISDIQFLEQITTAKNAAAQVNKEAQAISKENAQDLEARQKNYDQTIKEADTNYQRGEYQMALLKYKDAQKLFPDRAYPNDRVAELQDLVKALEITERQKAEQEEKYRAAITKANGFFDQKSYADARPVYAEALQYKPGDVYANGRINDIDKLLAELAKQKQYKDLVAQADKNRQSKNFDQAIAQYNQAKQLLPEENYPQEQIDQIGRERQEIAKTEQLDRDFNQAMQSGSSFAQQKDYMQALASYQKALGLKPDNKLATDKIAEVNQAIVAVENDKKYLQAIQLADQALAANNFEKAKMQYQEAIKFKATETYPKNKLAEISAAEANELKFEGLLSQGAKEFSDAAYDNALTTYNEALSIKPQNQEVQKRIADIQNIKKQQQQDQEYSGLIAQADELFRSDQTDQAVSAYNKALQLKKSEAYPKEQLQKIGNYQALIKKADKSLDSKDFSGAKSTYSEAIALKPEDRYASGKIAEIDKILEDKRLQEEKIQAELLAYNDAVKAADSFFNEKNYTASLDKYREAAGIKAAESYPKKRIKEVETILDELEKEKARLEKEYQAAIAQADKLLGNKDYDNSKAQYQRALGIKADEDYPKEQIRKIDETLAELKQQEEEKQRQEQEKRELAFKQAMDAADQAFAASTFDKARDGYQNALTIKPNDATAKEKLGQAEGKLAELNRLTQAYNKAIDQANSQLSAKKYPEAKEKYQEALQYLPDQEYPKTQITKIDEVLARLEAEAQTKRDFDQAVAEGENLLKSKELAKAKDAFTKAYNLIPSEPVPPKRIGEIDAMLAENARKEAEMKKTMEAYQAAVQKADGFFGTKDYTNAQLAYNEALLIKSDEKYPVDQLAAIDKLLKEINDQKYKAAIEQGDSQLTANHFEEATIAYTDALKLRKDDQYATGKLKEVAQKKQAFEAELARQKKLDEQYQSLIAEADKDFGNKLWPVSKGKYQNALALKPTENYPGDQIRKIDDIVAENQRLEAERLKQEQEKTEQVYRQAMAAADQAFEAKDYSNAKSGYENALTIKANDPVAKDKLGKTEGLIAELARLTQAYNKAIDQANTQLTAKKYQEAKDKYQEALQYLPEKEYPKTQIAKIDEVLAQQEAERKTRLEYDQAVADGENMLRTKDFAKAKDAYMRAYNLIPSEQVPPQKIAEINSLLAEQARKDSELKAVQEAYDNAIKKADTHFGAKEYTLAQLGYNEALLIKSGEKYPTDQLALIDKLVKEQNEKGYQDAIAKADNLFNENQFDESASSYQEALKFRSNDQYASNRLKEIDQKKKDLLAEKDRLEKLDEQYNQAITAANTNFRNKTYPSAKDKYLKALTLKPNETYPKEQITKIEQLLAEQQKAEDIDRQYAQFMKQAQTAFNQKKLKDARDLYQKSYGLKPYEAVPPAKIAEIDKLIADQEETARLAAMEEAQRLAKEKADKEQYARAIAAGDKAFGEKQYQIARVQYTTALTALPNERYPKDQIAKIEELLQQEALNQSAARQKAIQDSMNLVQDRMFDEAMTAAQTHEENQRHNEAIEKYREAIAIEPDQKATIQKYIDSIEEKLRMLAKQDQDYQRSIRQADDLYKQSKLNEAVTEYGNASKIKPDEEYPKTQISIIRQKLSDIEQRYTDAIKNADAAYDASDWATAKVGYTNALEVKPKEQYPADRLKDVTRKLDEARLAAANQEANEKAYNEAMEKAEKLFGDEQLVASKMQFQVALTIKPEEKLPAERIKAIDALLAQRKQDELASAQRELDEKYRQALSVADNSFREKSYAAAKGQYKQALSIKPAETYPQDQIALIDRLEKEAQALAAKPVETPKPVVKPVSRPVETEVPAPAKTQAYTASDTYDEALKKADDLFGVKDYTVARFYYYKASELKPAEAYPKNQVEAIRKLIDSQLSSGDLAAYNDAIAQADRAFSGKNYSVAKFYYNKALEVKSWEQYPKDRINEILALTNSLLSEREEKEYHDVIAKADEALVNKDVSIARFYYNRAASIKRDEDYPRIKLNDIRKMIEQDRVEQENQEYRKIIDAGDEALKAANYSMARFNYNKALTVRPGDKYAKDQLKLIKEALDKKTN